MEKVAGVAAAASGTLAWTAIFADLEPVVTFFAAVAAVVAGCMAAWYHYERARYMRGKNEDE